MLRGDTKVRCSPDTVWHLILCSARNTAVIDNSMDVMTREQVAPKSPLSFLIVSFTSFSCARKSSVKKLIRFFCLISSAHPGKISCLGLRDFLFFFSSTAIFFLQPFSLCSSIC